MKYILLCCALVLAGCSDARSLTQTEMIEAFLTCNDHNGLKEIWHEANNLELEVEVVCQDKAQFIIVAWPENPQVDSK